MLKFVFRLGRPIWPLPTVVACIIPDMSGPLMLGNNHRDAHTEDPETQQKVNAIKNKKIFFFGQKKSPAANLMVKTFKRMHMDMKVECKRLGCSMKTIENRSQR